MMIVSASLTNGDLYLVISKTSIFRRPGKMHYLPSGKHTKNYGTWNITMLLMGKSTISMGHFQ